MAVDLTTEIVTHHKKMTGDDVFTLAADEKLVIKTGVAGALVDRLDERVPNGKSWTIEIFVRITEVST